MMSDPEFLYRGAKQSLHESNGGNLIPKAPGLPLESVYRRDGAIPRTRGSDPRDLGAVRAVSVINTIHRHQLRQEGYPTPGISTTPHFENAKAYALWEETSGVVYKIAVALLPGANVRAYRVADFVPQPSVPIDEEIILLAEDGMTLPSGIVVEVVPVAEVPGA